MTDNLPSFWIAVHSDGTPGAMRAEDDPFDPEQIAALESYGSKVAEYVPRPRWIPVAERLPEEGVPVLGFSAAVFAVQLTDKWWVHAAPGQPWVGDITHWMPLPDPPEAP